MCVWGGGRRLRLRSRVLIRLKIYFSIKTGDGEKVSYNIKKRNEEII